MVSIPGGTFKMGSNDFSDSKPVHTVTINSILMDEHEVTNEKFTKFVTATKYKTVAERALNPTDYPGIAANKLVVGSAVFTPTKQVVNLNNPL